MASHTFNLGAALRHPIYNAAKRKATFGSLLDSTAGQQHNNVESSSSSITSDCSSTKSGVSSNGDHSSSSQPQTSSRRILVIFIRHFFCGNCQEYLRRLAKHDSFTDSSLASSSLSVAIIGCGSPSLIPSYRALTDIPSSWHLYADPSTELYRLLGMQRSLSLGDRSPRYIQRTLTGNMLRSIVQGVRRIPEGDVLGAGWWDINGGEYLFEVERGVDQQTKWQLKWSHQMQNSRDHTEVEDLLTILKRASELPIISCATDTPPEK